MAKHLIVSEFMSTNVAFVTAHDTLLTVTSMMHKKNISCVMVLEKFNGDEAKNQPPIGIITERNIVHHIATHPNYDSNQVFASELTPSTLVTIKESDSLFEAMVLCRSQRVKHLAVINEQELLKGLITYSDMVDANYSQIEMQAELLGNEHTDVDSVNAQLLEMTLTDPMLKVGNRRSMEIDLKQTHEFSKRYHRNYSIALIDIDYFKKYNDNYGHQAGDQALINTCNHIKNIIRSGDRLYRYGGEEFLLLMPETANDAARVAGQRIVDQLAELNLPHAYSPLKKLTASVGLATIDTEGDTIQGTTTLINFADTALYAAKNAGRNQIHVHTPMQKTG